MMTHRICFKQHPPQKPSEVNIAIVTMAIIVTVITIVTTVVTTVHPSSPSGLVQPLQGSACQESPCPSPKKVCAPLPTLPLPCESPKPQCRHRRNWSGKICAESTTYSEITQPGAHLLPSSVMGSK